MGRGIGAAAAMGQLRAAVIALSQVSEGPAELLRRLDAVAERFPGAEMATIACVAIDPAAGRLAHASAGHLPPLVITDDGATFLWEGRSLPLGVDPGAGRDEGTFPIAPGAMILLYTDGLIERRGESIDAGLAKLIDTASRAGVRTAHDLIAALLALEQDEPQDDDVALIAVRIEEPTPEG
jgi:serine phosphatase RsbU (regulator of sigma subunit)